MKTYQTTYKELIIELIRKGDFPKILYKYVRLGETLDNIISKREVYFQSYISFNDPFDSRINLDYVASDSEIKKFVYRELSDTFNTAQLDFIVDLYCQRGDFYQKSMKLWTQAVIDDKGISCFSKNKDNLLMWAHYAEKHTGVCLGFSVLNDVDFFIILNEVRYSKEYISFNPIKDFHNKGLLGMIGFIKSREWAYEEEYRIHKKSPGIYKFNPDALVEINFGVSCPEKERNRILETVTANEFKNTTSYITKLSAKKYQIYFDELNK